MQRQPVAQRREQLLNAAIEILTEEGSVALTTRRVTEEAGVALGAFHYVFRDKNAMLEAIMERFASDTEKVLTASVEQVPADAGLLDIAVHIVGAYWRSVVNDPLRTLAEHEVTMHALRDEELRPLAVYQQQRQLAAVRAVFARFPGAVPDGQQQDLASYLVATMSGLVLHHSIAVDPQAAERRLALYLDALPSVLAAAGVTLD